MKYYHSSEILRIYFRHFRTIGTVQVNFIENLRAWSSKLKPLTSSGGHWNSRLTLFSAVLSFDSLTDNLSSRTSSFDHSIKANQLGPDLVKVYLLLDYYIWNIFDFCKVLPKMNSIDFFDFRSQNGMTPP